MTCLPRAWVRFACLGAAGFLLGCQPAATPPPAPPGPPPASGSLSAPAAPEGFDVDSGPNAAGKKVFVASDCFRCHAVNGVRGSGGPGGPPGGSGGPGGPRGRGPDLGKVGRDDAHTVQWFMNYVRNPKSQKPDARMPPFEGKIKDDDLRVLAEYLASLKQ